MNIVDVNDNLLIGDSVKVSDNKINKIVKLDKDHLVIGCFQ